MAVKADDLELDLIDSILEAVADRLGHEPSWPCAEFVRQYYHWVPSQDLRDRDVADLAGAVLGHWEMSARRRRGETKVAVFNPDTGRDGWRSPYTVLEVVCDDMPFLVDSVTMELNRQGYAIELLLHPVMRVLRDGEGIIADALAPEATARGAISESVIHAELVREADSDRLAVLRAGIEVVLEEVRAAVEDYRPMRAQVTALAHELSSSGPPCEPHLLAESEAFLRWLADDNFTFLGYREYELGEGGELCALQGSGLGILRGASHRPVKQLGQRAIAEAHAPNPLVLSKANARSTVHRPAYLDYVGVKRFDDSGTVVGERRFLGLYTSTAYHAHPDEVPLLRDKVDRILHQAAFSPDSHDAKGSDRHP